MDGGFAPPLLFSISPLFSSRVSTTPSIKNFSGREILNSRYCHHFSNGVTTFLFRPPPPPPPFLLLVIAPLSLSPRRVSSIHLFPPLSHILKIDSSGSPFCVSRQLSLVLVNLSHQPLPPVHVSSSPLTRPEQMHARSVNLVVSRESAPSTPLFCPSVLSTRIFHNLASDFSRLPPSFSLLLLSRKGKAKTIDPETNYSACNFPCY